MRLFILILFVGLVFSDEQITKAVDEKAKDVKDIKKEIEEPKSKTEKRDYSDQTGSYELNTNDGPFKPMLTNNHGQYEVAAAASQQIYYDKSQLTADEEANTKGTINRQAAANVYREPPYSRVVNQQHPQQQQQQYYQQQQQQHKHNLRVAGKNAGIQENQQQSILYAEPHNAAYNYERIPQQQQQQQQLQHQQQPAQRGQQKQIQYVIAIPISYLRQLQQQILYEQQQQQSPHLQTHKGQQQPVQQQQQQPEQQQQQPIYAVAGPLARDHQGSYRPFHRFSPQAAVNDVPSSPSGLHRSAASPFPAPGSAAPPGYITQYIQIPASVLLAAAQSAQVQQRPFNIQHQAVAYQQQQQSPQHHQQNTQAHSPQLYYYQPQLNQQQQQHYQQQQQQQPQLKQSQTSHVLTPPPLYDYQVQQQSGTQQHQAVQQIPEQYQQQLQYQQQSNVGRQQQQQLQHQRIEGVRSNGNLRPSQHAVLPTAQAYVQEQEQLASIHAQSLVHAHNQQPAPGHKLVAAITPAQGPTEGYEHIVHYNPQYLQQYLQQPQQQQQIQQQRVKYQQSQHRLQLQLQHPHQVQHQQQVPLVDNLNNSPYPQGIHGPTPLPYVHSLQPPAAAATPQTHLAAHPSQLTPYYNYNLISNGGMHQPFVTNALQPSFAPLGVPSKVTSFTNVLLQPFTGHHHHSPSYQIPEMGSAAAASTDSLPFFNQHTGGIHYGTHLYHPPTPPTPITSNQQQHTQAHQASRAAAASKASTKTAKASTTAGSQTVVKYP